MDVAIAPAPLEATHKRVMMLALPMTLAHATTPLLGVVDATVIGRLGEAHLLGAVALGAVIFDFVFWTFGSLRMATAGLTAQAAGAGDDHAINSALARAMAIAALIGVALIVLQWPIAAIAFPLAGASEATTTSLATYFSIRIWAAPFTLLNYVILGSTLGRGRTDVGLLLQVALNLVNIALTAGFVIGFGWGIAGAATGTVLAEIITVGLGLLALRRLGSNPLAVSRKELLDPDAVKRTISVNRDVMIRTIALISAFAIFTAKGARAGDVTLAANAVLYNLFLVGCYFLDGFATAAEALCGQSIGAGDEGNFRRAVRLVVFWSIVFGVGASLVIWIGGGTFIDFMTTNPAVRGEARDYLPLAAIIPVLGATAFAFDGIYTGATWTKSMRNLMVIAALVYAASVFTIGDLSNGGLWASLSIFFCVRGLGQFALYPSLTRRSFAAARQ
jgi:MATE family multidrug resistance protein